MPRQALPLNHPDTAAFVRALGQSLRDRHATRPEPPGHVELLNLVARAAGFRSFQALKASSLDRERAAAVAPPVPPSAPRESAAAALSDNARKALPFFDEHGSLKQWPVKFSVQKLAIWALWTRFEAKRRYTEREVNTILKAANGFGDHVTLRRELINHRLMARATDCSEYHKLPARPDDETRRFLAAWRAQCRAGAGA